jgi:hypothetical protein
MGGIVVRQTDIPTTVVTTATVEGAAVAIPVWNTGRRTVERCGTGITPESTTVDGAIRLAGVPHLMITGVTLEIALEPNTKRGTVGGRGTLHTIQPTRQSGIAQQALVALFAVPSSALEITSPVATHRLALRRLLAGNTVRTAILRVIA